MTDPLRYHMRFTPSELDAQYNLRTSRPDVDATVIPEWARRSEAARRSLSGPRDIRYGRGERQKLDVFRSDDPAAPTLVYFHGGYWQRGDKSLYSFLALPFVAAGVNVAVVGYDLCPAVTVTRIAAEAREAMAYLWRHGDDLGIARKRITVMGHSAGGHITQMIMATDWPTHGADLSADLVAAGIPVSPLSYLEPVRLTEAINATVGMDAAEAEAQSPMTRHPPATDAPQMVVVGGAETAEFQRQAAIYVDAYATATRPITLCTVPEVDHFDVINRLVDASSPVFEQALTLIAR
ncbi:MAG: alpha/beta hydrolase [Pseudomonadota bacterium]